MATNTAAADPTADETPWIDAWIRWERNSKSHDDDGGGGGENATSGEDDDAAEPHEGERTEDAAGGEKKKNKRDDENENDDGDDDSENDRMMPSDLMKAIRFMRGADDESDPEDYESEKEEDGEEAGHARADPTKEVQTVTFRYPLPPSDEFVDLEIAGYDHDSEEVWNSTGLAMWRSGGHLCDYIVKNHELLRGKRVLELGSGTGRSGLLAHHVLAASDPPSLVCLTDGDTDTLRQLRLNVERNPLPRAGGGGHLSCHQLIWGERSAAAFLASRAGGEPFDVVLGADLIYVPTNIAPLFQTVQTLLSRKRGGGPFVMAHCSRRQGNSVTVDMVLEGARRVGLDHELVEEHDDIYVFVFRWSNGAARRQDGREE